MLRCTSSGSASTSTPSASNTSPTGTPCLGPRPFSPCMTTGRPAAQATMEAAGLTTRLRLRPSEGLPIFSSPSTLAGVGADGVGEAQQLLRRLPLEPLDEEEATHLGASDLLAEDHLHRVPRLRARQVAGRLRPLADLADVVAHTLERGGIGGC